MASLEQERARTETQDAPTLPDAADALPEGWRTRQSSDGILAYAHDPAWEITGDEPGSLDFRIDDDTGLFFSWNWPDDLLGDLRDDEEFLRFFEEDLLEGDGDSQFSLQATDEIDFMGESARYWRLRMASEDGYVAELLTVFYPCSAREICNLMLVRLASDQDRDARDWSFLRTFAAQVDFLTTDKATVNANANLRSCPSTECEIVGRVLRGEIVEAVGISPDGDWYRLRSGAWISASLVDDAPPRLPVVDGDDEI